MGLEIKAKVYSITDSQTSVKAFANVNIGGVMCINSYTISNKIDDTEKIYAFPPSYKNKEGKYKPFIEFPNREENELLKAIYKACLSAYKKYEETGKLHEYGETFSVNLETTVKEVEKNARANNDCYSDIPREWQDEILMSDIPY